MNDTHHRWDLGTLCDDIFRYVEQLLGMSIHGTHGRVWPLARLGRGLGDHARRDEYRIHRMRDARLSLRPRDQSCTDSPPREHPTLVCLYPLPTRIIDMARGDRVFWIHALLPDRRVRGTDHHAKSSTPRTPGSSIRILTIDGEHRLSAHRVHDRSTHSVPRDAMGGRWWYDSDRLRLVGQ